MALAQTLAKYYRNVDTRLGGVLPGGVPVGYEGEENVTVTNIPPKIIASTTTYPTTITTSTPDTTTHSYLTNPKINPELQKVIRDIQIQNIQNYATSHSQELYNVFSPSGNPSAQDQASVNKLQQFFSNLGPEGGKAWENYKTQVQVDAKKIFEEASKSKQFNIPLGDYTIKDYPKGTRQI